MAIIDGSPCPYVNTQIKNIEATSFLTQGAIAAPEEHGEDRLEQIKPLQIAPQEISGMPARTRNVILCCALAIFCLVLLKILHDDFFKKLSVLAFLTCVFLGHYFLALPYIERWLYRAPKNLGM
jgi:hypothetical protein